MYLLTGMLSTHASGWLGNALDMHRQHAQQPGTGLNTPEIKQRLYCSS
jgi:hypothetical protein